MDSTSNCVYQFTCTNEASYIGQTRGRLSDRFKEHQPSWLNNEAIKNGQAAITKHLIESGLISTNEPFRPVYIFNSGPWVKSHILSKTKVIAIHLNNLVSMGPETTRKISQSTLIIGAS